VESTGVIVSVVEGRAWRYEPSVIEVPLGTRVKMTLVNSGRAEHDMEFPDVPASQVELVGVTTAHGHHNGVIAAHAMPGTTATVLFTPTVAGEYGFGCTLRGHIEGGMVGKLIVTAEG
jgi:uncharacterized cupredoxin-like copper-binding protein